MPLAIQGDELAIEDRTERQTLNRFDYGGELHGQHASSTGIEGGGPGCPDNLESVTIELYLKGPDRAFRNPLHTEAFHRFHKTGVPSRG